MPFQKSDSGCPLHPYFPTDPTVAVVCPHIVFPFFPTNSNFSDEPPASNRRKRQMSQPPN